MRTISALLPSALGLFLGACSNPFLSAYVGERFPSVAESQVVTEPPSPQTARWIGRADFSTDGKVTAEQAIAAAKAVGADLVEWSDRDAGTFLRWSSDPISVSNWTGQISTAPMPVAEELLRCSARFYRSSSLGGFPSNPGAEPTPSAVPAAANEGGSP